MAVCLGFEKTSFIIYSSKTHYVRVEERHSYLHNSCCVFCHTRLNLLAEHLNFSNFPPEGHMLCLICVLRPTSRKAIGGDPTSRSWKPRAVTPELLRVSNASGFISSENKIP